MVLRRETRTAHKVLEVSRYGTSMRMYYEAACVWDDVSWMTRVV